MDNIDYGLRAAAYSRARLEAGLDLTRALGAHLNWILHLAREAAEHRKLALEAASPDLRDAHLEFAAAYQHRIDDARRAQYWSLERVDPSFAQEPPRRAA